MGLFDAIDASGSGLSAERLRMDVTSENLANAQTTRGADGQPYRRKEVVLQQAGNTPTSGFSGVLGAAMSGAKGVQVAGIVADPTPLKKVYDPGHPDADAQGYVTMPNVNSVTEMVDLISASRAYEADVTAMQTAKTMFSRTLDILR
jgi:flagellar basal-body rod protein FlgC